MKTLINNSKAVVRIAVVLTVFGFLGLASESVLAQQGKGRSNGGGGKQVASKSKQQSSTPKVNRDDKTPRYGKTLSAGPGRMPHVDRDDKHRFRGTYVQNGANPAPQGGGRMPSTNMLNNKYPEDIPHAFHQRSGNNASKSQTPKMEFGINGDIPAPRGGDRVPQIPQSSGIGTNQRLIPGIMANAHEMKY